METTRVGDYQQSLAGPAHFAKHFVEAGALAWPNDLELNARWLHKTLRERGE